MSQQLLILVKGLPGCGKSTLAAALARALQCPLVDKDDARDCFQPLVNQAPLLDWNALSYAVMFRTAERQLSLGLSVVLDSPFARRQLYDDACQLATEVISVGCSSPAAALTPAGTSAQRGQPGVAAAEAAVEGTLAAAATLSQLMTAAASPAEGPALEAPLPAAAAALAAAADASVPPETAFAESAAGARAAATGPATAAGAAAEAEAVPSPGGPGSIRVVVVDVECSDEVVWRRRLEARGGLDRGADRGHKPCSWEELLAVIRRYGGSWSWSTDGSVALPYHVRVCTASNSTEECVRRVLEFLEVGV